MVTEAAWHESHDPTEPRTIGAATGLVYCRACGFLLSSDRNGPSWGPRATSPCVPAPAAAPDDGIVIPALLAGGGAAARKRRR